MSVLKKPGPLRRDLKTKLWEKIAVADDEECWEYQGSRTTTGYGYLNEGGTGTKRHYAHRLVAEAKPGEIVRHSCDNPPCCNPKHLTLGTSAENSRDMVARGRSQAKERHWNAKLSAEDIEAIRADLRDIIEIADDYPVTARSIRRIRQGKRWT